MIKAAKVIKTPTSIKIAPLLVSVDPTSLLTPVDPAPELPSVDPVPQLASVDPALLRLSVDMAPMVSSVDRAPLHRSSSQQQMVASEPGTLAHASSSRHPALGKHRLWIANRPRTTAAIDCVHAKHDIHCITSDKQRCNRL